MIRDYNSAAGIMQSFDPHWKEKRIREYKEDRVLEGFRKMLFEVYCYAQPIIIIFKNSPKDGIFDIDAESSKKIEAIKDKMKEYVIANYSDIFHVNSFL